MTGACQKRGEFEIPSLSRKLVIGFVLLRSSLSVAGCFEGYVGPDGLVTDSTEQALRLF